MFILWFSGFFKVSRVETGRARACSWGCLSGLRGVFGGFWSVFGFCRGFLELADVGFYPASALPIAVVVIVPAGF